MPNTNTAYQAYANSGKSSLPSAAGGASSTSEFQFADSSGNPFTLQLPGSNKLYNRPFRIRMWGRITSASTPNITLKIYYGTSTTIGSNTAIANTSTLACTASGNFLVQYQGVWDSTSTSFGGKFDGWACATTKTDTVSSSVAVPASAPSTEGLGFTATATFSGSNASNTAILDGFELEVL